MSILIKGARVIDAYSGLDGIRDILIEKGKLVKLEKNIKEKADKIIHAQGKVVIPGLIDLHAHLREPGREDEETILSGSWAGVHGGYTVICCMPNTQPPIDHPGMVNYVKEQAKSSPIIILPYATISKNREGKELAELGLLRETGAVGFSDDGSPVMDALLMRRALEYSLMLNVPIISHCEDLNLSRGGVMNEGELSTILGLKGIPAEAEEIMVERDLKLAQLTGAHLHIAHVSTKGSVDLIREAKEKGVKVTCEVTPHHLILTEEALLSFNPHTKVNPPLRRKEDVETLQQALKEGVIDVIATDHAPHLATEKEKEIEEAPFGMIGLDTCFSLIFTYIVEKGILSLKEVVEKMSLNPAKILNLPWGRIKVGEVPHLTIFDPEATWIVKEDTLYSKSKNTPFLGWELKGKIEWVIIGERILMERGKCLL